MGHRRLGRQRRLATEAARPLESSLGLDPPLEPALGLEPPLELKLELGLAMEPPSLEPALLLEQPSL